jgi:excisionase family DNA binding protein
MAKQPPLPPDVMTPSDVSTMYGVPESTVRDHIRKNKLIAAKLGRVYVMNPKLVKAYAEKVGWEQ